MHSCRLGQALGWGPAGGPGTGLAASAAGPYASAAQPSGMDCARTVPAQQNKASLAGLALQLRPWQWGESGNDARRLSCMLASTQ